MPDDGLRQGMLRAAFSLRGKEKQFLGRYAGNRQNIGYFRQPLGQGAGFIEDNGRKAVGCFQVLGVAD